jgi:hypothetical protein
MLFLLPSPFKNTFTRGLSQNLVADAKDITSKTLMIVRSITHSLQPQSITKNIKIYLISFRSKMGDDEGRYDLDRIEDELGAIDGKFWNPDFKPLPLVVEIISNEAEDTEAKKLKVKIS